jgi:hypothetical protein
LLFQSIEKETLVFGMPEEQKLMLDIGTIMHNLLFSYQKSLKSVLGTGSEVFVDPTINLLLSIEEEDRLKLVSSNSLDEALRNFGDFLVKSKVINSYDVEKTNEERYTFKVNNCVWARHIHKTIQPKDVVCPFGLVAMALYKKFTGNTVNARESNYYSNGSETTLEPLKT